MSVNSRKKFFYGLAILLGLVMLVRAALALLRVI
jgi:hypothetical protein